VILMNLTTGRVVRPALPFLLVVVVLGAFLGALTLMPHPPGEGRTVIHGDSRRIMAFEEKQAVISVLDHLEEESPELSMALREFKIRVFENPIWVVEGNAVGSPLVWTNSDGLVFSASFFTSDAYTQLNTLLKVIDPAHASLKLKTNDIVVLPE
jgi:hypothetical protein